MAEKVLNTIANCVNPRVHSSYIRLLCNGWMTGRRFQAKKGAVFNVYQRKTALSILLNAESLYPATDSFLIYTLLSWDWSSTTCYAWI